MNISKEQEKTADNISTLLTTANKIVDRIDPYTLSIPDSDKRSVTQDIKKFKELYEILFRRRF